MEKQDKRRLYIIGAILIVAAILLLLFKRGAGFGDTIINQGGSLTVPDFDGPPITIGDIPSLDYSAPKVSSRGCAVCYAGYGRIVAPAAPAPPPVAGPVTNKYLILKLGQQMPPAPPAPSPYPAMLFASNSAPQETRPWWEGAGTVGRYW